MRATMTDGRWPEDETPWPEGAALTYGEIVALTTPNPPVAELGWLGPEIEGTLGVVVGCEIEQDSVGPVYLVEADDGSPWRVRPQFLVSQRRHRPDMPPRVRGDLPEGTRVRVAEAVGEVTGVWRTTFLEPPKGYIVRVGERVLTVAPHEVEVLP
jgi:hypothetical protein